MPLALCVEVVLMVLHHRFLCGVLVTKKDAFPLPRIQDCLDTVSGATLFSTFDLTSGFQQIPVNPRDVHKTAFVTKYGLYEYKTLPMGLCNGPPTCQRLMESVLNGYNGKCASYIWIM
jgi:hypothetical protein